MNEKQDRTDELQAAAVVSADRIDALEAAALDAEAAALVSDARILELAAEVDGLHKARTMRLTSNRRRACSCTPWGSVRTRHSPSWLRRRSGRT